MLVGLGVAFGITQKLGLGLIGAALNKGGIFIVRIVRTLGLVRFSAQKCGRCGQFGVQAIAARVPHSAPKERPYLAEFCLRAMRRVFAFFLRSTDYFRPISAMTFAFAFDDNPNRTQVGRDPS